MFGQMAWCCYATSYCSYKIWIGIPDNVCVNCVTNKSVAGVATEILDPPFLSKQNVRLSTTQEQMLQAQSDASSLRTQLQVGRLVNLSKKKQQLAIAEIKKKSYDFMWFHVYIYI